MTLQDQINEYQQKQDALLSAAAECARIGDDAGYIKLAVEAFFMEHPVTAMLRTTKKDGFFGGSAMIMPIIYGISEDANDRR